MEVIYADKNLRDIGVLRDCEADFAFGKDENDFEISIELPEHCCNDGFFVYVKDTEYGGIIDSICPDTEKNVLKYKGRTWHGILENKVIEPGEGEDYLIVSGDANDVLSVLIEKLGLNGLFCVEETESGILISNYQFKRYVKGYTGIRKMLSSVHAKLEMRFENKKLTMKAMPVYDYSIDEEWDESQIDFQIEKNYRPVNHLICLGSGDLKERNVIHLFTDENGGVQPYAVTDNPYKDSDYITDKSNQILKGEKEVAETYDYNNAGDTNNYVLVNVKPDNWDDTCTDYFTKTEDERYDQVKKEEEAAYAVLTSAPPDWNSNYGNYFIMDNDKYKTVDGDEKATYILLTSMPADWSINYSNAYYYYYSDGVISSYKNAESVSRERYLMQTSMPTDWKNNYNSYYVHIPVYQYVYTKKTKQKNGTWKKETVIREEKVSNKKTSTVILTFKKKQVSKWVYETVSGSKPPSWKPNTYYTKENYTDPPKFEAGKYYKKETSVVTPEFQSGKYYEKQSTQITPGWKTNTYYQLFVDHYANIVLSGIEKIKEYWGKDTLKTSLDPEYEYDIGDIVGGNDRTTGIKVAREITKKIVKIEKGYEEISYEIGE